METTINPVVFVVLWMMSLLISSVFAGLGYRVWRYRKNKTQKNSAPSACNPFIVHSYSPYAPYWVNAEINAFVEMVDKYVKVGATVNEPLAGYGDLKTLIKANLDSSVDAVMEGLNKRNLTKVSDCVLKSVSEKLVPLYKEQEELQKIRRELASAEKRDSMSRGEISWVYERLQALETLIDEVKWDQKEIKVCFEHLSVRTFPDSSAYLALRLS